MRLPWIRLSMGWAWAAEINFAGHVGYRRQKRYFNANWIRRGATEVWVITPKFAVPSVVPGLLNWGWLREL